MACTVTYGSTLSFLPLFLIKKGLNSQYFFVSYGLTLIFMRAISGRLSDRFGRASVIIPGIMLLIITMFLMPFINSVILLVIITLIYAVAVGSYQPTLATYCVDKVKPSEF